MHQRSALAVTLVSLLIAACTSQPPAPGAAGTGATSDARAGAVLGAAEDPMKESAECAAARLRPAPPLPASAIADDVLRRAQTGWVSVRYDVVQGKARHAQVVSSHPTGLYDAYVLRHANAYTEPTGANVRGCLMTVHIRF